MTLPLFPSPGPETVINEPGHYKGYFCATCPGTGRTFDYKAPVDWTIQSCAAAEFGGHGCCYNCYVILVDMIFTGIIPPEPEIKKDTLLYIIAIIALLWITR